MGMPMALNLTRPDGAYIVSDARDDSFTTFDAARVQTTTKVANVAEADIIFLSLPSASAVRSVLLGDGGLADRLRPGAIVADTSTIAYEATLDIAARLAERAVDFLDAPVSGMQARAEDGTLTIMCGGDGGVFDRIEPLLARMGSKVLFMGGHGAGQLAKLINQLLFDVNAAALAEILPMAVKMGLDPSRMGEVVNSGTGRSYASEFFIPRILKGHFSDGYPMSAAYKDLISAAELGAARGIPMPVLAAATATYQQALLRGLGDHDKGGMIRVFEDLLGVAFRAPGEDDDG